jgi:hypothetical protein
VRAAFGLRGSVARGFGERVSTFSGGTCGYEEACECLVSPRCLISRDASTK